MYVVGRNASCVVSLTVIKDVFLIFTNPAQLLGLINIKESLRDSLSGKIFHHEI